MSRKYPADDENSAKKYNRKLKLDRDRRDKDRKDRSRRRDYEEEY